MSRVRRKRHRMTPEQRAEAAEARRVAEQEAARKAHGRAVWVVVRRHARPNRMDQGRPMRCRPSRAELRGEVPRRTLPSEDWKIIYDSREAAEACARELLAEVPGAVPQHAYHCRRMTTHGHWHLQMDSRAARRAAHRAYGEDYVPKRERLHAEAVAEAYAAAAGPE